MHTTDDTPIKFVWDPITQITYRFLKSFRQMALQLPQIDRQYSKMQTAPGREAVCSNTGSQPANLNWHDAQSNNFGDPHVDINPKNLFALDKSAMGCSDSLESNPKSPL